MRKVFLTFASSNFEKSLKRLKRQALEMNFYDEVHCLSEDDLDPDFRYQFRRYLQFYVKGFGYWCWKPQIVMQTLDTLLPGDVIHYADVGCHMNPHGKSRLEDYFKIVSKSRNGVLAFQSGIPTPEIPTPDQSQIWLEREWSKGDVIDHFGAWDDKILDQGQKSAGMFLVRNCPESMSFIQAWKDVFLHDMSLVDNSKSIFPNCSGFKQHRHDQSVFSLLCAKLGVEVLSNFEMEFPGGGHDMWKVLSNYPVHAKRDRPRIKKQQRDVTGLLKFRKRVRMVRKMEQSLMRDRRGLSQVQWPDG